ncbi:unnamed protein product, partial [Amoebophrya sp. A120]
GRPAAGTTGAAAETRSVATTAPMNKGSRRGEKQNQDEPASSVVEGGASTSSGFFLTNFSLPVTAPWMLSNPGSSEADVGASTAVVARPASTSTAEASPNITQPKIESPTPLYKNDAALVFSSADVAGAGDTSSNLATTSETIQAAGTTTQQDVVGHLSRMMSFLGEHADRVSKHVLGVGMITP